MQQVLPTSNHTMRIVELCGIEDGARPKLLPAILAEEKALPLDLAGGPVMRVTILRYTEEAYVLMVVVDHIVTDGWSWPIFRGDLATLYTAFREGNGSPLEELEIQYADFALWQRNWLTGELYESLLQYWKKRLDGAPRILQLPTDRPRPAQQSYRGAIVSFFVPRDLADGLRSLNRTADVTLFMAILAAFTSLLYRYSGQHTICVGTPIANRNRTEIENLIGCFINTLVLRVDLAADLTFRRLLAQVREGALGAYAHQDMPFELLVEQLQVERSLSHTPLFQIMVVLQNVPGNEGESFPVNPGPSTGDTTAKFDMELAAVEADDGRIICGLQYCTDLFDESRMSRLTGHFCNLLEAAVRNPEVSLDDIPLIGEAERRQILAHTVDSYSYPSGECVHDLIANQAERTPERISAICGEAHLSYQEMDLAASEIADLIVRRGVPVDGVVGLLMDRNLEFLISVLGVHKSGCAYMPFDPAHPSDRIGEIVEQSGVDLILVPPKHEAKARQCVSGRKNGRLECLKSDNTPRRTRNEVPPILERRAGPDNLGYVIYTSGSTGRPKGAMVAHRGMLNHLFGKIKDLDLRSSDVVGQTASQCFDISVWQFLAPLLIGGCICIVGEDEARDPVELAASIERGGMTVVETVPSLLRAMLREAAGSVEFKRRMSGLRWMIATGETLPPDVAAEWRTCCPDTALMNAYGPTECSDDVTHYVVDSMDRSALSVPIGQPVINTQIYVLDQRLALVPIGVTGEVCVGGLGVGRGYLNDPVRTAEVFIPAPHGNRAGTRLYRTGDMGRWRDDGNVLHLGRKDSQVKLRGYRIELGEIEAVLAQHAELEDVAVAIRNSPTGEQSLVAYYVAGPVGGASRIDLKARVREMLPAYMVPAVFVSLEAMPQMPNGKLDRSALPEPDWDETLGLKKTAARTPTEELVAGIWSEVLQIANVGIDENFFELGGHSLLATQVISRVRKTFQCDVGL
ncbi:MAG TPA: amino acid adenylation domain-containing protein, partial [Blastocatellia bacterium]|nr:amino acid adenylation domain-containing protein [Blastocatellia bacterium]